MPIKPDVAFAPKKNPRMARPRKEVDTSTYTGRFAVRLKTLREKAGMSHEEAAEQIGVTPTAIYHWESARITPSLEKFPKISETYKVKRAKDLLPNQ